MSNTFNEQELLERVENDWDLLSDTVQMLAEDSPGLLADVRRAIEDRDTAGVARTAHVLKGMISNFCAVDAQTSAALLEQLGKSGDLPGAMDALHELEVYLKALIADLTDFVTTRA